MSENLNQQVSKVAFLGAEEKYVEAGVNVSERAFAISAGTTAFEPVLSEDCTLIIDPAAELQNQGFALIEKAGQRSICFMQNNGEKGHAITRDFSDRTFENLAGDETICGIVVQIKRKR